MMIDSHWNEWLLQAFLICVINNAAANSPDASSMHQAIQRERSLLCMTHATSMLSQFFNKRGEFNKDLICCSARLHPIKTLLRPRLEDHREIVNKIQTMEKYYGFRWLVKRAWDICTQQPLPSGISSYSKYLWFWDGSSSPPSHHFPYSQDGGLYLVQISNDKSIWIKRKIHWIESHLSYGELSRFWWVLFSSSSKRKFNIKPAYLMLFVFRQDVPYGSKAEHVEPFITKSSSWLIPRSTTQI